MRQVKRSRNQRYKRYTCRPKRINDEREVLLFVITIIIVFLLRFDSLDVENAVLKVVSSLHFVARPFAFALAIGIYIHREKNPIFLFQYTYLPI